MLSSEDTQWHGDCTEFGLRLLFLPPEPGPALTAVPKSAEDCSSLLGSMASPHLSLVLRFPLGPGLLFFSRDSAAASQAVNTHSGVAISANVHAHGIRQYFLEETVGLHTCCGWQVGD